MPLYIDTCIEIDDGPTRWTLGPNSTLLAQDWSTVTGEFGEAYESDPRGITPIADQMVIRQLLLDAARRHDAVDYESAFEDECFGE